MLYENLVVRKDLRVGLEGGLGARLSVVPMRWTGAGGHAAFVFLLVDVAVAADFDLAPFGEEIDHGDADAVQAAGGLVGPLLELAAELEHRHHAFERGDVAPISRLSWSCFSTGMPRPSSSTVTEPSLLIVTRTLWANCRPWPRRSSCRRLRTPGGAGRALRVVADVHAGRSRTCSRSLRCSRSSARVLFGSGRGDGTTAGLRMVFSDFVRVCYVYLESRAI